MNITISFVDPDFIMVGLGTGSKSFELYPWSEDVKSSKIKCKTPADSLSNTTESSFIGKYTIWIRQCMYRWFEHKINQNSYITYGNFQKWASDCKLWQVQ